MFIFRWLKKLIFLVGLVTVVWWGVQYAKTNSPIRQKINNFKQSTMWKESIKDFKSFASEIFRGVGKKLDEEDITTDEKKQLDQILEKELAGGGPTAKTSEVSEQVKKPEKQQDVKK